MRCIMNSFNDIYAMLRESRVPGNYVDMNLNIQHKPVEETTKDVLSPYRNYRVRLLKRRF